MPRPKSDKTLVEEALEPFLATLPRRVEADDIEHVFAAYAFFTEKVIGIGLHRVFDGLVSLTRDLPVGGVAVGEPSIAVASRSMDDDGETESFEILASGVKYVVKHAPRREQPNDAKNGIREIELDVVEPDGFRRGLACGLVKRKDGEDVPIHGACRREKFNEFINFMDAIRPALGGYLETVAPFSEMKNGELNFDAINAITQHRLIDRDGFLPGELCRKTVANMFRIGTIRLTDYMASVLPGLVAKADARGIRWGEAFLRYNDHDNKVTAIPTVVEGRSALYHRNSALIYDHNAVVMWCDRDADGEVIEFGAAALLPDDDRLLAAVEAVARGEEVVDAPVIRRRPQEKTIEFEAFFDTGLVVPISHYVAFDCEEIVDGKMDKRSSDAKVITDFKSIYFEVPYDADDADEDESDYEEDEKPTL